MKFADSYYALVDAFGWVLPHPISWLMGLFIAVAVFVYLVLHLNPRRARGRISHGTHFVVVVSSVVLYVAFHSFFIHAIEGRQVLGGFQYQEAVQQFLASRGNATVVEVISSFVAWSDPERVWTLWSLTVNRAVAAVLLGLLLGSVAAFVERVPKVRDALWRWLARGA